eukprot:scaffold921_cov111-Skeletonema_dohrnii-CCMP3373.AAC.1
MQQIRPDYTHKYKPCNIMPFNYHNYGTILGTKPHRYRGRCNFVLGYEKSGQKGGQQLALLV